SDVCSSDLGRPGLRIHGGGLRGGGSRSGVRPMAALNGVMMQFFHWYVSPDGSLWNEAASRADELAAAGFTGIWLPPAYKGTGGGCDVGYGVYDMYDLGEF